MNCCLKVLSCKMYIIEFLIKKLTKKKVKNDYNPLSTNEIAENYEGCEHIFMPIDSTNEVLSCTKCGLLVNQKDLKNKNFFMKHN